MKELSEKELMTMKCLWEAGEPICVDAIIDRIRKTTGQEYAPTTVYTFLARMKKKGYVDSYKKGASYFSPLIGEMDYLNGYAMKMGEFWGKASSEILARKLLEYREVQA